MNAKLILGIFFILAVVPGISKAADGQGYVLVPDLSIKQYVDSWPQNATTDLNLFMDQMLGGPYDLAVFGTTVSEVIAKHFCVRGDSHKLVDQMAASARRGLWPRSEADGRVLLPVNLRVENGNVRWGQPLEINVCVRKHVHVIYDDGIQHIYEYVCDEWRRDFSTLQMTISSCSSN